MKYYIMQSGKQRYAILAYSRSDAHKRIVAALGPAQWSYVNYTHTKEDVLTKYRCNIVTERKV